MSLQGKTIVVTRQLGENEEMIRLLERHGANAYELPVIKIVGLELSNDQKETLKSISSFDLIIFTSVHCVTFFVENLDKAAVEFFGTELPMVATVGPRTQAVAESFGIQSKVMPEIYSVSSLIEEVERNINLVGKKVFVPQGMTTSSNLVSRLEKCGANIEVLSLYETLLAPDEYKKSFEICSEILQERKIDSLTFASPSAVQGFCQGMKGDMLSEHVLSLPTICIGPSTSARAQEYGFKKVFVADQYHTEGMVNKLLNIL